MVKYTISIFRVVKVLGTTLVMTSIVVCWNRRERRRREHGAPSRFVIYGGPVPGCGEQLMFAVVL